MRVLGIDDFAFRKGNAYGTILVDLEQRKVVDLLPERSTQTTADWLREHPGVEVVSRDRSNVYARGISDGAPPGRTGCRPLAPAPQPIVLKELIESGKVTPVIDRAYPLAEVPEAIRYLEEGHVKRKVIITLEHNNKT